MSPTTFNAPEILLGVVHHDYKIDMWDFGVLFASLVFQKEPFFPGSGLEDRLHKMAAILGTDTLRDYCDECGKDIFEEKVYAIGDLRGCSLDEFITPSNDHLVCDDAVHLIQSLLRWNPEVSTRYRVI